MRICIDYRPALRHSTGVGTYVRGLLRALARGHPEDTYVAFSSSLRDRLPEFDEAPVQVVDWRLPVRLLDRGWHRHRWPPVEWLVGDVEVAHSPSPMLIPARDAVQAVTVHDCHFLRHRQDVAGPIRRDYVPLATRSVVDADAVFVPSRSTAREVEELMGVAGDKVHVTPLGIEPIFRSPPTVEAPEVRETLERLGIRRPYLLFVGRRQRRKDPTTLLEAMGLLLPDRPELTLVMVGPDAAGWDEVWEGAGRQVRRRCRLMPHQPPARLARIYVAAAALVLPSRWEGFGLPPLEAMACGTPVVATRVGALPEVLGDAPVWVEPGDPQRLADACGRLLDDRPEAERRVRQGRRRAEAYRWERTAELTHRVYRELSRP